MLNEVILRWLRWRLERRTVATLRALDARILDDIGIPPAAIVRRARRDSAAVMLASPPLALARCLPDPGCAEAAPAR